jgi:hypothetical protein
LWRRLKDSGSNPKAERRLKVEGGWEESRAAFTWIKSEGGRPKLPQSALGLRSSFGLRVSGFGPGFPPMLFGYSLRGHCPTERRKDRWFGNPKGIVSSSPGLPSPRGYPGLASGRFSTGLWPLSAIAPQSLGLADSTRWALGRNPFGIQLY